jgi:hypothetical protein
MTPWVPLEAPISGRDDHSFPSGVFALSAPVFAPSRSSRVRRSIRPCAVRELGVAPLVEIQECEHPLYRDQRDGVTQERVREFAHTLLHK